MSILQVVSGGQSGVDRAALDSATALGISCGGWCPRGRRSEDGVIDQRYILRETPRHHYAQRTEWNVRDSDGTLVLYKRVLKGGTLLTRKIALKMHRPLHLVDLVVVDDIAEVWDWIHRERIYVLNVAGPRESQCPGIYDMARRLLDKLFVAVVNPQ